MYLRSGDYKFKLDSAIFSIISNCFSVFSLYKSIIGPDYIDLNISNTKQIIALLSN